MGPSGSGKSTLLTLAGGLDQPTRGTVRIEGEDVGALGNAGRARMRRTSVGYVFQDFNLIPALTAAENVALPRELDGEKSPSGAPPRADRARGGRHPRPRRPLPRRDVRRAAAAGRHRPRHRGGAAADPGRRADRRARHRHRRGDPAAAAGALRRRGGRRARHPRGAARRLGRPGGVPARRGRSSTSPAPTRSTTCSSRRSPGELVRGRARGWFAGWLAAGDRRCGWPGATRCERGDAACWSW